MLTLLSLVLTLAAISGFPVFQTMIPNGYSVPNPCTGGVWAGVGHTSQFGGGAWNPFGDDFATSGHAWTESLCLADSDGDGKTNGEELGDPNCQWTTTNDDQLGPATGHPGICELDDGSVCPSDDPVC